MKLERLQEIKKSVDYLQKAGKLNYTGVFANYCRELIAAYENQGELLQLSLANVDRLNEELADAVEMLAEEGFSVTDEKGLKYATLREQLDIALGWINANPNRKRAYELDNRNKDE